MAWRLPCVDAPFPLPALLHAVDFFSPSGKFEQLLGASSEAAYRSGADLIEELAARQQWEEAKAVYANLVGSPCPRRQLDLGRIVRVFARAGRAEDAHAILTGMFHFDFLPDMAVITEVFRVCARSPSMASEARELYNEVISEPHLEPDLSFFHEALAFFAGDGEAALRVMAELQDAGLVADKTARVALLRALAADGLMDRANTVLRELISERALGEEDVPVFLALFESYSRAKDAPGAEDLLDVMVFNKIKPTQRVLELVLGAFDGAKRGEGVRLTVGCAAGFRIPRSKAMFEAQIMQLCEEVNSEDALAAFDDAVEAGVVVDLAAASEILAITYNVARVDPMIQVMKKHTTVADLNALFSRTDPHHAYKLARTMFDALEGSTYVAALEAGVAHGEAFYTSRVISDMLADGHVDADAISVAIVSMAELGEADRAAGALHKLTEATSDLPSVDAFSAVISAHCKAEDLPGAEQMLSNMHAQGRTPPAPALASMMGLYAAAGDTVNVEALMSMHATTRQVPTADAYTALMRAYSAEARPPHAIRAVFDRMVRAGVVPSAAAFVEVMSAYSQGDMGQEALLVYRHMVSCGVEPDPPLLARVVQLLEEGGHGDAVRERMSTLIAADVAAIGEAAPPSGSGAGEPVWDAVLGWASRAQRWEDAREACEHVARMGYTCPKGNNALLLAYAQAGKVKEAVEVHDRISESKAVGARASAALIGALAKSGDVEESERLVSAWDQRRAVRARKRAASDVV